MELSLLYSPLFAHLICPLLSALVMEGDGGRRGAIEGDGSQWSAMERDNDGWQQLQYMYIVGILRGDQGQSGIFRGDECMPVREIERRPGAIRDTNEQ